MIREAIYDDVGAILDIYNDYIVNTAYTFEEVPLSHAQMAERIHKIQVTEGFPWLVALIENQPVAYAYATKWKERSAYRYSVEATVYVAPGFHGRGLGTQLYQALFEKLKQLGINAVMGGITLPNPESIALHEKVGMKKVAHLEKVGFKFERWRDVGYWQINLKDDPGSNA